MTKASRLLHTGRSDFSAHIWIGIFLVCGACAFNVQHEEEMVKFIFSPAINLLKTDKSEASENTDSSSTIEPSYFGYEFTLHKEDTGVFRMIIGSPKMIDPEDIRRQKAAGQSYQSPRGSIQACEIGTSLSNNQHEVFVPAYPLNPKEGDNFGLSMDIRDDGEGFACSTTRELDCGSVRNSPGFCFKSTDFGQTWNTTKHTMDIACPTTNKVEVLFVLDGSHSVGKHFGMVKTWVKNISKEIGIDHGAVSVGVVQYSANYTKYMVTHIRIGSTRTYKEFAAEVDKIELQGFTTWTGMALNKVLGDFQNTHNYNKTTTKQVMVLLTDGKATDPTSVPRNAEKLREIGVIPYAVGVSDVNRTELRLIATGDAYNDTRVYMADSFAGLDAIAKELKAEIKGLVLEGGHQQNTTNYKMNFAQIGFAMAYGKRKNMRRQRGTSANSNKNGRLYLGAVGAYDWSGTVTKYDSVDDTTPDIPTYDEVKKVLPNRTKESYMGYSVTTGYFEDTTTEYVATGAPRYTLMGAVIVYKPINSNNKFNNHRRLMGHPSTRKLGSYFGGSVLAVDVNNDGKDDLFVGAPLYVHENYDEGRVFVYVSEKESGTLATWERDDYKPLELTGDNLPGGRFGTAMASAGDLNMDGFKDVIVGAPLAEGDRGAVFVYHGNAGGVDTTFKQKILASEMKGVTLKYFGQSLQGGVDLDGNKYPDIAVGAPKSDTVVIFRSRPVVSIESDIKFITGDIDIFECIDKGYANCTKIRVCFTANGTSVEDTVGIKFNVTIDSEKSGSYRRLEFRDENDLGAGPKPTWSQEINPNRSQPKCLEKNVHMKSNIKDYDSAIVAEVEFDLLASHTSKPLSSVRDPSKPNKRNDTLNFVKSCGSDGKCDYDLRVEASVKLPEYTTSKGEDVTDGGKILVVDQATATTPVRVMVNLSNHGENAFDTRIDIVYTSLISLSTLTTRSAYPATNSCVIEVSDPQDSPGGMRRQTLRYNYKTNIMRQNAWCFFEFNLIMENLKNNGSLETFQVQVEASTTDSSRSSAEQNPSDNSWSSASKVLYRSDFSLKKAGESQISFNYTTEPANITSITEIGNGSADIVADVSVSGNGYSKIPYLDAMLRYPLKTAKGDMLLYLYKVECSPKDSNTRASCMCDTSVVNTYNLTLEAPNANNTNGSSVAIAPAKTGIEADAFNCHSDNGGNVTCETLKCTITDLSDSGQINVKAYFRLWSSNIIFTGTTFSEILLRSRFQVDSKDSLYIVDREGKTGIVHSEEIVAKAKKYEAQEAPPQTEVALWIYILAAIGGLLLLVLLVLILWKVGFFKSKYADMKKDAEDDLQDETDFQANGNGSQAEMVD